MKQKRRIIAALLVVAFLLTSGIVPLQDREAVAEAAESTSTYNPPEIKLKGWIGESNGIRYYTTAKKYVTGWKTLKKKKYYFSKKGFLQTGWVKVGKKWCYLNTQGVKQVKKWITWKGSKYYVNAKGYMVTGKQTIGKKVCTFRKDGSLAKAGKKKYKAGKKKVSANVKKKTGVKTRDQLLAAATTDGYKYEVIPLVSPLNQYFYIKTNNPDPDSFCFVDPKTKYSDTYGTVSPTSTQFEDVTYVKKKTLRVKGGYIAQGSGTDGGELYLRKRVVTGSYPCYNLTTGETTYIKEYSTEDTYVKVKLGKLVDDVDYLIQTYASDKKGFFNKMDAVQSGLSSICLYSGVYVLGDLTHSKTSPYYGLSTSPHVDQTFYIQEPYSRSGNKSMLISALYPYRLDSIGFPSKMSSVATRLNSKAKVEWSGSAHYIVNVTVGKTTKAYGGQGYGGGQGIFAKQIKYKFTFDGSKSDAYTKCSMTTLKTRISNYGKLKVDTDAGKTLPKLTMAKVRKQVGEGKYVRLILINSIFGGSTVGYTYMYDDGNTGEGSNGFRPIGHFYNAWFEGRYYNTHEYYYPGATLEQTVKDVQPSIVLKDAVIRVPDDGKTYYTYRGIDGVYKERPLDESGYDPKTGVWKGYTTFTYDAENECWVAKQFSKDSYYGIYSKESGTREYLDSEEFRDQITITMDEAKEMNIDGNTDVPPSEFLIYDMSVEPGTKGTN